MMAASLHSVSQPRTMHAGARVQQADGAVNVEDSEGWLSLLGGGLLALCALRRSLGTGVLLGGAGAMFSRELKGQCALYQTLGVRTVAHDPPSASPRSVAAPDEQRRRVRAGS